MRPPARKPAPSPPIHSRRFTGPIGPRPFRLDSFVSFRYFSVAFVFYPSSDGKSRFVGGPCSEHAMAQTDFPQPGHSVDERLDEWLGRLRGPGAIGALLEPSWDEQLAKGYGHTLREICQQ